MTEDEIEVRSLTGPALEAALDDVARLRIAVFRDWPITSNCTTRSRLRLSLPKARYSASKRTLR